MGRAAEQRGGEEARQPAPGAWSQCEPEQVPRSRGQKHGLAGSSVTAHRPELGTRTSSRCRPVPGGKAPNAPVPEATQVL